jgi:hypothetical protein
LLPPPRRHEYAICLHRGEDGELYTTSAFSTVSSDSGSGTSLFTFQIFRIEIAARHACASLREQVSAATPHAHALRGILFACDQPRRRMSRCRPPNGFADSVINATLHYFAFDYRSAAI